MPSLINILLPERVSTLHVVLQEAGYCNLSSFTREFRKHFACCLKLSGQRDIINPWKLIQNNISNRYDTQTLS
ncbi:helix-turn-helix transcriptional regulator [Chitinophaga agri]|uniref:Helix-turn-helix transcriptional regulator n=1 Tax=Chitinophaga agri TaxID=2703787 RepID=A0A6B9ZKV5_9BACT|nr:helix-turn-helix transcriptional regulator [Chitinophaga agri]QHS63028.1 helix-turn-helix transcriptional regulator [Chitinophaga agri]